MSALLQVTAAGLWRRRRRSAGIVLAVFLGVAFLSGALALGDTLSANFQRLFASANAGTDVVVRSATEVGRGIQARRPLIPASLAATVETIPGVADAQPQISGYGQILGSDGKAVGGNGPPRTAGNWIVDPDLNPYHLIEGHPPAGPGEVVINKGAADSGHLRLGQYTTIETPDSIRVRIVGIATFGTAAGVGKTTFVAFTLSDAERYIAGRAGQVTQILVRAKPDIDQTSLADRIARQIPTGVQAVTGASVVAQNISDLSGAFLSALRTFLVVFAAIALLVALLSIVNTFSIVVAQRTRESALLRLIGASRRQVLGGVLLEALLVGLTASCLGLVGGLGIAEGLKGVFSGFGFALPAGGLVVTAASMVTSLLVGVIVTILAAILPARRASRVSPLEAFRSAGTDVPSPRNLRQLAGIPLFLIGLAMIIVGLRRTGNGILGVVAIGALICAVGFVTSRSVITGPVLETAARLVARRGHASSQLAAENVRRNPRRALAASTALLIGVAVVTLFTVFAASLKQATTDSYSRSFAGDVAITTGSFGGGGLPPELAAAVSRLPQVARVLPTASAQANIDGHAHDVTVLDPAATTGILDLRPVGGPLNALAPGAIAVSAHQATASHWTLRTIVSVTLPDGTAVTAPIGAIYRERALAGDFIVPLAMWAPHTSQLVDNSILVKLTPSVTPSTGVATITRVAAGYGRPTVQDRSAYLTSAAKTVGFLLNLVYVLLVLAIAIAVLGIANTLSLSVHERIREIGLLRAVGQTRSQLRSMIRCESVLMSSAGTVGGIALGVFLGWTFARAADQAQGLATFTVPIAQLTIILVVGALAGLLAASRPAKRATLIPLLTALAVE